MNRALSLATAPGVALAIAASLPTFIGIVPTPAAAVPPGLGATINCFSSRSRNCVSFAPPPEALCGGCNPDSWVLKDGVWYWWNGSAFSYAWKDGETVHVTSDAVRLSETKRAPGFVLRPTRPPQ